MADWRVATLRLLGAPVTPQNLGFFKTWQRWEGGHTNNTARWNWLNSTTGVPGAVSAGVGQSSIKAYPNFNAGVQALVATLKNGRYGDVVAALKAGDPYKVKPVAGLSTWVSGSPTARTDYAAKVLGMKTTDAVPAGANAGRTLQGQGGGSSTRVIPGVSLKEMNQIARSFGFKDIGHAFGIDAKHAKELALSSRLVTSPTNPNALAFQATPPTTKTGKAGAGVAELFYDPAGSHQQWDQGNWISPIGGHSDHVHVSFSNPQTALRLIQLAQDMGLYVGENPYTGSVNPSVHVPNSFHDRTFAGEYNGRRLGEAIDVSGPSSLMMNFYRTARRYIG